MATPTFSHMKPKMLRATTESIADAKAYQQAERQKVTEATGLIVTDDGVVSKPFEMGCPRPGCTFIARVRKESRMVQAISAHLVWAHFPEHLRRQS